MAFKVRSDCKNARFLLPATVSPLLGEKRRRSVKSKWRGGRDSSSRESEETIDLTSVSDMEMELTEKAKKLLGNESACDSEKAKKILGLKGGDDYDAHSDVMRGNKASNTVGLAAFFDKKVDAGSGLNQIEVKEPPSADTKSRGRFSGIALF